MSESRGFCKALIRSPPIGYRVVANQPLAPSPQPPIPSAMNSRQLGQSGRVINEIAYGNWITHGSQVEKDAAVACVRAALEEGVTTSDTADVYARIAAFVLVAVAGVCGVSVCAGETAAWTPARLWQGFDPEQEPLEIEVVQEWSEQGVRFQKLFFTGERAGDAKVRVFAIVGMPVPEAGTA